MIVKPHIVRELAALANAEDSADAMMFRRTASDVMTRFVCALTNEFGMSTPRIVQVLKRLAIDFDQPVKIELIFDVIAGLEIAGAGAANE